MAIGEVTNVSSDIFNQVILEVGKIGLWIQAIGLLIILWLIFQIIALISNRKKRKKIYEMDGRLRVIERKIDRLLDK